MLHGSHIQHCGLPVMTCLVDAKVQVLCNKRQNFGKLLLSLLLLLLSILLLLLLLQLLLLILLLCLLLLLL